MGAELYASTQRLSYGRELLAVLAGPAVNLICAPLFAELARTYQWEWCYMFSGAHLLLGVFNLLPIRPLDGGRALYLAIAWHWGPATGENAASLAGTAAALMFVILSVWQAFQSGGVLFPMTACGLLIGTLEQRNLAFIKRLL